MDLNEQSVSETVFIWTLREECKGIDMHLRQGLGMAWYEMTCMRALCLRAACTKEMNVLEPFWLAWSCSHGRWFPVVVTGIELSFGL